MAYASWSVVAGEQPSAAKWGILGTNDAFFEDFIIGTNGVHAAWTSFTPSFTNVTVGNGTNAGRYIKLGTTVLGNTSLTFGNTSAMGTNPTLTLPVNSSALLYTTSTDIGTIDILDSGTANFSGALRWTTTSTATLTVYGSAGTYANQIGYQSTVPMTWTTNDQLNTWFFYHATS